MNGQSLHRLIRHVYRDGTHSFHYVPVEVNKDDALVNKDDAVSTNDPANDPADRFTYWPPQPMTVWLSEA
jgi:hypothetical protein